METIYRQKSFHKLTSEQQKAKLQKDNEYEIAVQNLSASFYQKKRTVGVTAEEEETYKTTKADLWGNYYHWAVANELYEVVTPEQQLTEAEDGLSGQLAKVNSIRTDLGRVSLEVKEGISIK